MLCLNFLTFVKSKIENVPIVEQINGFELSFSVCMGGGGGGRISTFQIRIQNFVTFAREVVVQLKLSSAQFIPRDFAHCKLQNKKVLFHNFPVFRVQNFT